MALENIGLLRHFPDVPDRDGRRDTGLIEVDPQEVKQTAVEILEAAQSRGKNKVILLTSPLRRALQTNKIIAKEIINTDSGVVVESVGDERAAALRHGIYAEGCNGVAEKAAWNVYVEETFQRKNPLYRHGDSVPQNGHGPAHPELVGLFKEVGEHQWEFSRRLYSLLAGISYLSERGGLDDVLMVLCSHTAIIMRTLELDSLAQKNAEVPIGEIYLAEWDEHDVILDEPVTRKVLKPGGFGTIDFKPLANWKTRIEAELRYLRVPPGLVYKTYNGEY